MKTKKLLRAATAGFKEKNDLLVNVMPAEKGSGINVNLESSVFIAFGEQIISLIKETTINEGFSDVIFNVIDKGAWNYTIKARVITALERGISNE